MSKPEVDSRCLECNHEFPHGNSVLTEIGWGCPRCQSTNIESIAPKSGFNYNHVKVKYLEGNHD